MLKLKGQKRHLIKNHSLQLLLSSQPLPLLNKKKLQLKFLKKARKLSAKLSTNLSYIKILSIIMQFKSYQDVASKELESQLVIWRKMVMVSIRFAIVNKMYTNFVTKFESDMPIKDPRIP